MASRREYGLVAALASRPPQLLLILGVYWFGATVAVATSGPFDGQTFLLGLIPLLPLAASIHYANEYADVETDARTDRTPFSGGSGALPATDTPRRFVLWLAVGTLLAGVLATGVLGLAGQLRLEAVAVLAVATVFGWQYSLPPLQLAWRGWGEVTNAALGGLCLPLYGGAVVGNSLWPVAVASIPFSLLVLLNLFATQWPDRRADGAVGKDTLAVRWPRRRLKFTYVGISLAAGGSLLGVHILLVPQLVVLASLPAVPFVIWGAYGYTERHMPWPTVSAMVSLVALQTVAWTWIAYA